MALKRQICLLCFNTTIVWVRPNNTLQFIFIDWFQYNDCLGSSFYISQEGITRCAVSIQRLFGFVNLYTHKMQGSS